MTGRVLNEADLVVLERYLSREPHLWWAARTQEVIDSHRLLQERVGELEAHHKQFVRRVAQDMDELTQAVRQL